MPENMKGAVAQAEQIKGAGWTLSSFGQKGVQYMRISPKLRAIIIAAIDEAGGVSGFARKVNLSPATVSRYRGGQIKSFSDEAWLKIRPIIADYADLSNEVPELCGTTMTPFGLAERLPVDQQMVLKKYVRLNDDQKIKLVDYLDQLLLEKHVAPAIHYQAAEKAADYCIVPQE